MYYHIQIAYYDNVFNEKKDLIEFDIDSLETVIKDVTENYIKEKNFIFRGIKLLCSNIRQVQVYSSQYPIEHCQEIANSQLPYDSSMFYDKEDILSYTSLVQEVTAKVLKQTQLLIADTLPGDTVEQVRMLEKSYLKELNSGRDSENRLKTINIFDEWYRCLLILLSRYYDNTNEDYRFIKNVDVSGNGYIKAKVYDLIKARVAVLLDAIESQPKLGKYKTVLNTKKIYSVFVSSTYEDLKAERLKAMSTIVEMGHIPIGMEQFPAAPIEAFEYIKRLIDNADYYLLLLAGKYGTIIDGEDKSYTQKEYEYAVSKDVPVIFLTIDDINRLNRTQIELDAHKAALLEKFRKEAGLGRLRRTWSNVDDLSKEIISSLNKTIEMFPRVGWVRADTI